MKKLVDAFLLGFFSFALPFTYVLGDKAKPESVDIGQYFKQVGDFLYEGVNNYGKSVKS
ncbi:MAG: hypothetical protein FWE50_04235 [Alphaproteobacteria bacterium]|nr:hypothetical protein [Alphaproteobacteria bacterium]